MSASQERESERRWNLGYLDAGPVIALFDREHKVFQSNCATRDVLRANRPIGREAFCAARGLQVRNIDRVRKEGWVSFDFADKICCRLGTHPVLIYGSDWTRDRRRVA